MSQAQQEGLLGTTVLAKMLVHRVDLREAASWCRNSCSEAGTSRTEAEWEDKGKKERKVISL